MSFFILVFLPVTLAALWIWFDKPIARAARRQLSAEIADLRAEIRRCDEELLASAGSEAARARAQATRDQCLHTLVYLETKVKVLT